VLIYLARRVLAVVPVLFGVTLAVFSMLFLVPGDPVKMMLAEFVTTPDQIAQMRAQLHLDEPVATQYGRFVWNAVRGDLGTSIRSRRPVTQEIGENLASTGAERAMAERVVLLVLARSEEVLDTQDDAGNRAESAEEGYRIKSDQVRWALSKLKGAKEVPILFFDVLSDDHQAVVDQIAAAVEAMRVSQARRVAEAGAAIEELIRRYGEAQTKEAQDEVRRRLRIFIEQHLEVGTPIEEVYRSFISAVRSTHVRTVWATTRRNGAWSGLHAYHWLGVGTAVDAQGRSQPIFSGLDELLGNMLGDEKLEPARDYLNEIRRTILVWKEHFLKDATASGREIYRAEFFLDDKVWDECVEYWGGGSGYRDRVARHLEDWCDSHQDLEAAVEKRVQSAWREAFLLPIATLCTSVDLLAPAGPQTGVAVARDQ